jgi:hypothetical protein
MLIDAIQIKGEFLNGKTIRQVSSVNTLNTASLFGLVQNFGTSISCSIVFEIEIFILL